jgi:hypothetical protein
MLTDQRVLSSIINPNAVLAAVVTRYLPTVDRLPQPGRVSQTLQKNTGRILAESQRSEPVRHQHPHVWLA